MERLLQVIFGNKNGVHRPIKAWNRDMSSEDLTDEVMGIENNYLDSAEYKEALANAKAVQKRYTPKDDNEWIKWEFDENYSDIADRAYEKKHAAWDKVNSIEKSEYMKQYKDYKMPAYPVWKGNSQFDLNMDVNYSQLETPRGGYFLPEYVTKPSKQIIVSMSPREYMINATQGIDRYFAAGPDEFTPFAEHMRSMAEEDGNKIAEYAEAMLRGDKFPVPMLKETPYGINHDGRHRAMAALMLGQKRIPVMLMGDNIQTLPSDRLIDSFDAMMRNKAAQRSLLAMGLIGAGGTLMSMNHASPQAHAQDLYYDATDGWIE